MKIRIAAFATSILIHCYFAVGIFIAFVEKNNKKRDKKQVHTSTNVSLKEHKASLR